MKNFFVLVNEIFIDYTYVCFIFVNMDWNFVIADCGLTLKLGNLERSGYNIRNEHQLQRV